MGSLARTPLAALAAAALVTATWGTATATAAGPGAGSATGRTTLPGSTPAWATAAHRVGPANGSRRSASASTCDNRDAAGAAAYARAVSTKGSALYGKFLTPAQYRSRFSPTDAAVSGVKTWLRGQGFTIGVGPDQQQVRRGHGTSTRAAKAFGTSFATYRYQGQTMRSNTTALSVPSSLPAGAGASSASTSRATWCRPTPRRRPASATRHRARGTGVRRRSTTPPRRTARS